MKTYLPGGITAVPGILAAGMAAGIKKGDIPDLALIVSEREATIAGVFTLNKVVAAPVLVDRQRMRRGRGRAILANSGNANACTGRQGYADAMKMAALAAKALRLRPEDVFVVDSGHALLPPVVPNGRAAVGGGRSPASATPAGSPSLLVGLWRTS